MSLWARRPLLHISPIRHPHLFIYSNTTNVRRSKAFYEKCDVSKYVRVIAIAKMNLDNRRENMSIHFIILHFSFIWCIYIHDVDEK